MNIKAQSTLFYYALLASYFIIRCVLFLQYPIYLTFDSYQYLHIATLPIFDSALYHAIKPPLYPLLLKLFHRNVTIVALVQLLVSITIWSAVALYMKNLFHHAGIKKAVFLLILLMSCGVNIIIWDPLILTESFSIALFLALLLLWHRWLTTHFQSIYCFLVLMAIAVLFASIRDTNTYLLLLFALTTLLVAAFMKTKKAWGGALLLVVFCLSIFALSNYSANLGRRWYIPFQDLITKRFLCQQNHNIWNYFKANSMPTQSMTTANWKSQVMHNNSPTSQWLQQRGKTTYMQYLITHPVYTFIVPLGKLAQTFSLCHYQQHSGINSTKLISLPHALYPILNFYSHSNVRIANGISLISNIIAIIFLVFFLINLIISWRYYRTDSRILFALCLMLISIAISYLIWHGDAMEIQRHELLAMLQLKLAAITGFAAAWEKLITKLPK